MLVRHAQPYFKIVSRCFSPSIRSWAAVARVDRLHGLRLAHGPDGGGRSLCFDARWFRLLVRHAQPYFKIVARCFSPSIRSWAAVARVVVCIGTPAWPVLQRPVLRTPVLPVLRRPVLRTPVLPVLRQTPMLRQCGRSSTSCGSFERTLSLSSPTLSQRGIYTMISSGP